MDTKPIADRHARSRGTMALVGVLALLVAACGDDGAGALSTSDAWARTSPAMAEAAAVYLTLESDDGVSVVGATVDATVAARAELHETSMAEDTMADTDGMEDTDTMADTDGMEDTDGMADTDAMGDHSDGGAMTMREVDAIEVPAGGSVSLEPGGLHIMLLELAEPLVAGSSFDLTLVLDDGEEHQVSVDVRDA